MAAADKRRDPAKRRRDMVQATMGWRRRNPGRKFTAGHMIVEARVKARRRDLEFSISSADIVFPDKCPVFGTKLVYDGSNTAWSAIPSLDRVNNALGYVPGNVVVISWLANHLKGAATGDQLRSLAAYCTKHGV